MRKKLLAIILCASMLFPASVSAEVLGYEATLDTYTKEKKTPQQFQIDDGAGNTVNVLAKSDTLYVTAKNTEIRSNPGDSGTELRSVILGTKLERIAVCDNGWSKVTFQKKGEDKIIGYVSDSVLSDTEIVNKFTDTVTAAQDSDILDYPGKKDGEVVGEVLQDDELKRTGTQMTVVQITSAIFRPAVWKVIRLRKWPRQSRKRIQKQDPLPRVPGRAFLRMRWMV